MELARRIKLIRKAANLTQAQVADSIGVTQPTYSEYEKMAGNCAFYTLQKIARGLNVSIPFLVDIKNEFYKEPVILNESEEVLG
ncbi:MAG: helix-turn-helix transcriptional regulator [bacterium]|nr:helix-turn-helix transcriptional regulator [bacterium]